MAKKPQNINLQDTLLYAVMKERVQITVFFSNGFQFKGIVKSFDNYTILLVKDGKEKLIFKSAITTISPQRPVDIQKYLDKNVKTNTNLQDKLLNAVLSKGTQLQVFFAKGFQFKGNVESFDTYTILIRDKKNSRLIYKSSISTLEPLDPLNLEL